MYYHFHRINSRIRSGNRSGEDGDGDEGTTGVCNLHNQQKVSARVEEDVQVASDEGYGL